jgi:hypothetical protein
MESVTVKLVDQHHHRKAKTMGRSSYNDELKRASARADVSKLREQVTAYYEFSKLSGKEQEDYFANETAGIETFFSTRDDPDLGLAMVALAASMYDDPHFLFLVAAGPLEDILWKPSRETIERVVAEARKNSRIRWMLTGIFLHAISDKARLQIVAAIGTMTADDPMPPRSS